jgi:hypothetical protein
MTKDSPRCPDHGSILYGPPGGRMFCQATHPVHYPPKSTWDVEPRWLVTTEVALSIAAPTEEQARHRARLLHSIRPDTPGRPTLYVSTPAQVQPEQTRTTSGPGFPAWVTDTQRCRFFNGLMNQTCKAGINYDTWKPGTHPCLLDPIHGDRRPPLPCASAEYPTTAEALTSEAARQARMDEWARKLESDVCPHCDQAMTKKQVGPCVYAEPCGHRLYQGRIA